MIFVYVFIFLTVLLIYKRVYFKPISAVLLTSSCVDVISVKPSKVFFRSFTLGGKLGFVPLSDGYIAAFVDDGSKPIQLTYKHYVFRSDVIIFKSKFLKLRSLSLSDRVLSDIISKFVMEVQS